MFRIGNRVFGPERTVVMGVLNVTPDSFSDGGRFLNHEAAILHGLKLAADGADLIDVGGESTRPGAASVPLAEELSRVLPVVEALAGQGILVSIDTQKPEVAEAACRVGATLVNDVSGLRNPQMIPVVRDAGASVCIMHMLGAPDTMQRSPSYDDVVTEIVAYLESAVQQAIAGGVAADRILVDPGIGFGKRLSDNLALITSLGRIRVLTGCPVLAGVSRKSFLGRLTGREVHEREAASIAATTAAIFYGAGIVRVHDVRAGRDAAAIADALRLARES